jgi:hypothetical protein
LSKGRKRRGRKAGRPKGGAAAAGAGNNETKYLKIEQVLERLVTDAENLRDHKLAESLRTARRLASAKLV